MITPLDFLHFTKDENVLEHQKANEKKSLNIRRQMKNSLKAIRQAKT
jgi:hypothetical protein